MYRFNDKLMKKQFGNVTRNYILNELYDTKRTIKGLLSNAILSPNSSYHFHSLEKFNRGDILTLDDDYYLFTGDIVNDRVNKYKGIADYCNFNTEIIIKETIVIGKDGIGRPIYETRKRLDRIEYGVLRYKDISINDGNAINTVIPIHTLFVQDNEKNRSYFKVNNEISYEGGTLRVFNIVYTKRGLLEIRVQ